jgi:hypothetical protein
MTNTHRKKRAVKTTCTAGRENNLVPGPLYGGSPVHVRSFTMVMASLGAGMEGRRHRSIEIEPDQSHRRSSGDHDAVI